MNIRTVALSGLAILCGSAAANAASAVLYSRGATDDSRILAMHNRERARMQAPPLQWDPQLAASAASYGPALARLGRLQHSPRANRPGQRENLWMGSRGAFSPEQMVGTWIDERREFRPGVFPNVSRTGNWSDVAHYTQLIWKGTTRVGCAIHASEQWDFLICRYSPPGNIDGRYLP
ncbi:MAG TPA: CAP domain-containing protein [Sphingomicrobium sp.]|nr:CAP domain-containing protein [Sphingomicrobium sp.]